MIEHRPGYRPEIDGLRAVSVLGVVLYHAGLGVRGGFVGVDVFFVISGYLVTGIILRGLREERFSLVEFWLRRIRRILPAATCMAIGVAGAGYFVLQPAEFKEFAASLQAQALLYANVHFMRGVEYFSDSAEYQPLLHTWSLAVEEQFYLIFPVLLLALHRLSRSRVFLVLFALTALSLGASLLGVRAHPLESFFLLPPRAWELMAGALLVFHQDRIVVSRRAGEVLAAAGIMMVLASMLLFDASTVFPGAAALLPVGGALAFLLGCKDRLPRAARLLASRPFVFVGLISYSLYLWHWPLFSMAKHLLVEPGLATRLVLIAVSFVLATASWRWIEGPLRSGPILQGRKRAFGFAGLGAVLLLAIAVPVQRFNGFPDRFSPALQVYVEDINWKGRRYFRRHNQAVMVGDLQAPVREPEFVVWGDSHGLVYGNEIDRLAKQYGLRGETRFAAARVPVTGLWRPHQSAAEIETQLMQNDAILESILSRGIQHVVLISRWSVNCSGNNALEGDHAAHLEAPLVVDDQVRDPGSVTPAQATASLQRQLGAMVETLNLAGVHVWVLLQAPEADSLHTARRFYLAERFSFLSAPSAYAAVSMEDHQARQADAMCAFSGIDSELFTLVDPAPLFFDNQAQLLPLVAERAIYRDDDHLTRYGAKKFVAPALEQIIASIAAARSKD